MNGGKVFEESAVFALGVLIWQVLHAFFQKEYTAAEANVPQAAAAKPEENMNTQVREIGMKKLVNMYVEKRFPFLIFSKIIRKKNSPKREDFVHHCPAYCISSLSVTSDSSVKGKQHMAIK